MAKKPPQAYLDLKEASTTIQTYNSILSLLHWDQETFMPEGAIVPRSEQIALLSAYIHELKTSRKYKNLVEKIASVSTGRIKLKGLSAKEKAAVREWTNEYFRLKRLPTPFIKQFSQLTSESSQIWQTAKKESNFKLFAPFLNRIIEMVREKASLYSYQEHPYDALLGSYEPCMTSAKLQKIFTPLKKELLRLLDQIRGKSIDDRFLHGKFEPKKQIALGQTLLAALPIEPAYSRLDCSAHPFSVAMHPHDSRITTRILPTGFMSNLFSILHEAGHSMYEMGLPLEHWGTPLAEPVSLSIHESQSRWWETLIGRSFGYWSHFYPLVQKTFPRLSKVPLERFYLAINKVSPSFIRVEADEVTYCLHVILRFEIESALLSGDLQVYDLPEAWRAKMKELLGVSPQNDREGCLQDIHWALGDFGYFPTYALGNLFAAHFFTAFAKKHPDWEKRVSGGDLSFIRDWLKVNIHSVGKQYDSEQLAKKVTGKPFSEEAYCRYLKSKYGEIYK